MTIMILLSLTALFHLSPRISKWLFCGPAALISGLFLGRRPSVIPGGFLLSCPPLDVHVTKACSGLGFFTCLILMLSFSVFGGTGTPAWKRGVFILTVAISVTWIANASRILLGWYAGVWSRAHFPESLWNGVHFGVGVCVFLFFLIMTHGLTARRIRYESISR